MKKSAIEWTNDTWNPWHGCRKVSPGCKNCYMYRDKKRWGQDGSNIVRSSKATFNAPFNAFEGKLIFYDEGDVEVGSVDWVITGGESGPGFRTSKKEWFEDLQKQCEMADVPFFHKQNGGTKKIDGAWGGRELSGKVHQQMPKLQFRRGNP